MKNAGSIYLMLVSIGHSCPLEKVVLRAKQAYQQRKPLIDNELAVIFAAGVCIFCNNPILMELSIDPAYLAELSDCIIQHNKRYSWEPPEVKGMWPTPTPPYNHPSLPDAVQQDFVDLQEMLKEGRQPHFIITGCRSVLETAVKALGGEGKRLVDRIDDLKLKAVVNGVLADWAHQVRLEGNGAVHDRSGTPDEAAELVEFTKLFLQYTFEFPSRVQEGKRAS